MNMKTKKLLFLLAVTLGLTTLMSTTCKKDEPAAAACDGVVSATATGEIDQIFCFDLVTTYNYDPANYISLWAHESSSNFSFDCSVNSENGQSVTPGTYQCGPDNPGFVELINEQDGDFYKSQSGTLTITSASETNITGSFSVVAKGYYNNKTINFNGNFSN
jgi:hypothetical protein